MNDIKIFEHEKFGKIRVMVIENQEWFVGKDIAEILKYKDTSDALKKHIDIEDKMSRQIPDPLGRQQNTYLVNESGLYSLIFGSKMKEAKKFKKWVTSEVLPMIRKTGMYITDNIWAQIASSPEKIGELLIDYGKAKEEHIN